MTSPRPSARSLWKLLEPIHAVTYFSPEPLDALKSAGFKGFWMGYFAGRAAPLGPTSAEVVHALFYNFSWDHVRRAIPDAWGFASPDDAIAARLAGSVLALRRQLGDLAKGPEVERAAELASRAARSAPLEGRALFAANRALSEPDLPLPRLWHAATLLREHRGDGHVAALTAAGIGGREAHVLQAIAQGTPREVYAVGRNLDEEEWDGLVGGLRERGVVDDDGQLTEAGRRVKQVIEDRTDALASTAYDVLDDVELAELANALTPISTAIVASGDLPQVTPIGLDLSSR